MQELKSDLNSGFDETIGSGSVRLGIFHASVACKRYRVVFLEAAKILAAALVACSFLFWRSELKWIQSSECATI